MSFVGVANWESKLIGVGCDGASVNLGSTRGLKGLQNHAVDHSLLVSCPQARTSPF